MDDQSQISSDKIYFDSLQELFSGRNSGFPYMLIIEDNAIELNVVKAMLTYKLKVEEENVEFSTDGLSAYNKIKQNFDNFILYK